MHLRQLDERSSPLLVCGMARELAVSGVRRRRSGLGAGAATCFFSFITDVKQGGAARALRDRA